MSIFQRVLSTILCSCMVLYVVFAGVNQQINNEEPTITNGESVVIWYTDEVMTDYLSACAVAFHEKYDVRVIPQLHSGLEYLESVYDASVRGEDVPDLYIISNEALEKAYLAGLASEITDMQGVVNTKNFPVAALNAVSYDGIIVGYPYYFETSVLLYNQSYIYESAKNLLMAAETNDDSTGEVEDNQAASKVTEVSEEEIQNKISEMLPTTFDGLLSFANDYDAPANVETVFKWDVSDIFYNYFFVGNYLNVGGSCGDDPEQIDIYNLDAIKAMQVYQDMNQFFAFETEDLTYDSVIQEFIEGKVVLTTATSDVIKRLDSAKEEGAFTYEYGLKEIPDLNEEMQTKSMSVTNTLVINGLSDKQDAANLFATYLIDEEISSLYQKTGKIPSRTSAAVADEKTKVFYEEYSESAPVPKMMVTSNFWVELEITFSNIWSGKGVSKCMQSLSEMIMEQVTGAEYEEEYIDEPTEETTIEYLDEEVEREAAKKAE